MKSLLITCFIFGLLALCSPAAALAQGDTFTPPTIVDGVIAAGQGFVPCSGTTCSPCDLVVVFNTLLKWFMGIAFLVFAILAMKMGVTMVTSGGNPGALSAAKKSFTNAFIGLIIILSAWLIVDTFMRGLLGDNGDIKISNYGPWTDVKCATQTEVDEQTGFFSVEDYDPGDPNDQTEYSGQPTAPAPGSTDRCSPIPDSQLVTFPAAATSGDPERALADTVNRFLAMRAAAAKSNIDLKVSDGYRAPSDQLSAWNGNGCKLVNKKASCAVRTAAVPCSLGGKGSNHTLGTAVDIKLNSGVYSWLRANASKYGFYNHLSNDLPHWSSTGG